MPPKDDAFNATEKTRVILDTDIGNDIDDALALSMCHALQTRRECELLAVSICKPTIYAAQYVSIMSAFYGRPNIPIALAEEGPMRDDGKYIKDVVQAHDGDGKARYHCPLSAHLPVEKPVPLLRRVLATQPDHSVVICTIGFFNNVAALLESNADEFSPLSGRELIACKVRFVSSMAGDFHPDYLTGQKERRAEYNIRKDVASARSFIHDCPVPIVFTGLEVGNVACYPARSIEEDFAWTRHHPLVDAYRVYRKMPYDRPGWDPACVLFAIRPEKNAFDLSAWGNVRLDSEGINAFEADAQGRHRYLILPPERAATVVQTFVECCSQPVAQPKIQNDAAPGRPRKSVAPLR